MSVYARFKKEFGGLRHLVELLEVTPMDKRQKMIDVGMKEDPKYTKKALKYVITFDDVTHLPDLELAEVLAETPVKFLAMSACNETDEVKQRFLKLAPQKVMGELKAFLDSPPQVPLREVGAAQLKVIETTRKMEKKGVVKIKRIPN